MGIQIQEAAAAARTMNDSGRWTTSKNRNRDWKGKNWLLTQQSFYNCVWPAPLLLIGAEISRWRQGWVSMDMEKGCEGSVGERYQVWPYRREPS